VTVSHTNPVPIYCSQNNGQHCKNGMVAVINPAGSGDLTLDAYAALARNAGNAVSPSGSAFGGQVAPNEAASSSSRTATGTVTTTVTETETGASTATETQTETEATTTTTTTATATTTTGAETKTETATTTTTGAPTSTSNAAAGVAAPVAGLVAVAVGAFFV
jgi:carbohydrate-binding DOMON domain-containing protein